MNATDNFIQYVKEKGFTHEEAQKILEVYKKHRVIKFDKVAGGFNVVHGAFLDAETLRNALNEAN